MTTDLRRILASVLLGIPGVLSAQEPLSVIDWLNDTGALGGPVLIEPPTTGGTTTPTIAVQPLDPPQRSDGLVPTSVSGLPATLWQGGEPQTLARKIRDVPVMRRPAMQALLYTLLLSEALPAGGDTDLVLLARVDRLIDLGAIEPAQAMLAAVGPDRGSQLFARWFDTALLTGQEDAACAPLLRDPRLAPDYAARIFCTARGGDPAAATVMLDSAAALSLLPEPTVELLDRFLHPEAFEDAELMAAPQRPTPLDFRLHEAIGERLPTQGLPRKFASADLRDVAGWKSQLEAAERLTRTGALPANALLGLYTDRQPAASGGIWDRVRAFQRLETALGTGSADAIAKTLPPAWRAMQAAGLEVAFATLFAEDLAEQVANEPGLRALLLQLALLSPAYEKLAPGLADATDADQFLIGIARGAPDIALAATPMARAVARGFSADAALPDWVDPNDLGGSILRAMTQFDIGARGNPDQLTEALVALRRLGLEDAARSASLQLLVLAPT